MVVAGVCLFCRRLVCLHWFRRVFFFFFFFNDTATTEIYTLSLHDALPICDHRRPDRERRADRAARRARHSRLVLRRRRSEEHTSELQSLAYLVCRLLLEKKKITAGATRVSRQSIYTDCISNQIQPSRH